jgi:AraC-like DNA-binding protein
MEITALDLGLRGATAGIFLMMVVVLLRIRPFNAAALLAAALSAGGVAYVIATAPFIPKTSLWWTMPILAGNPVILWLYARATFDDDFVVRRWHGALWLVVIGIAFSSSLTWTARPMLAQAGMRSVSLVWLVLALSAALQTVRTWRADLIAGRRRLRIASLVVSLVLMVLLAGSHLVPIDWGGGHLPGTLANALGGSLATSLGMCALALLAGMSLFHPPPTAPTLIAVTAEKPDGATRTDVRTGDGRDSIAPLLLRRLDHLMTVERVHRQEGLTIAMLAAKLDLPEHRLRQVINEGLGYRNFNAFLNRYRLDEAKAALADPSQRDVPVLTIAMDAGFQSIGPFNRAFKAENGLTPTEFRRDALAGAQPVGSGKTDSFEIGQSGREFG